MMISTLIALLMEQRTSHGELDVCIMSQTVEVKSVPHNHPNWDDDGNRLPDEIEMVDEPIATDDFQLSIFGLEARNQTLTDNLQRTGTDAPTLFILAK